MGTDTLMGLTGDAVDTPTFGDLSYETGADADAGAPRRAD